MNNWQQLLDESPNDLATRLVYADWLEDHGAFGLADCQRWLAVNNKHPGPPCVLEAVPDEATWFIEEKAGTVWGFPNESGHLTTIVKPEWCLPRGLFIPLQGYIVNRRDCGFHNHWAKSWQTRYFAEVALEKILNKE